MKIIVYMIKKCYTCYVFEKYFWSGKVEKWKSVTKKCNNVTFLKKKCNSKKTSIYAGLRTFLSRLLHFYTFFEKTLYREKIEYIKVLFVTKKRNKCNKPRKEPSNGFLSNQGKEY